jgi:hypothetical protein
VKVSHPQPIHRHGKPIIEEALPDARQARVESGGPSTGRRHRRRHRRGRYNSESQRVSETRP